MHYGTIERAMKALWPGVSPFSVATVLTDASKDDASFEPAVEAALQLSGPDCATALMEPVARTLTMRKDWETYRTMHALDALIRAGGDPTAVLHVAVDSVSHWRLTRSASEVLWRAALRGWSLEAVHDTLMAAEVERHAEYLRRAQRLSALQRRGSHGAIASLARVYATQRIGNLGPGIGVLESQLLTDVGEEAAQDALVALASAEDMHTSWLALLPVLETQLRVGAPIVQTDAAGAVGQLRHCLDDSKERAAEQRAALAPLLGPVLDALVSNLASEEGRVALVAAEAIQVLAEHDAPLESVRDRLEAALHDARMSVRTPCSRALSTWLRRIGEEAELPAKCSHRRIYAATDDPLTEDGGGITCTNCESKAVVLYRHEDIRQFSADTTVEALCPECGIYSEHNWGYG